MSEKTRRAEAGYQRLIRMGDPKTAMLSVRITPADRDAIAALALKLGVTQSELVSRKVLGVNGHRFLPTGGHLIPHWWPSFLPAGGHRISPL